MNDLSRMRVMAVSFHFSSPLTISPLSVRYQRAWYLPRYASSWTWISARYLTFGAPYQPGTSNRSGKPWNGVSGSPFSAYASNGSGDSALSRGRLRPYCWSTV